MRKEHEEIANKLNQLSLLEFEGVKIGDMLHYLLIIPAFQRMSYMHIWASLVKRSIFFYNHFEVKGKPSTLFLFSNAYASRNDLLKTFNKVVELSENYLKMIGGKTKKTHFLFLRHIWRTLIWNKSLKEIFADKIERWQYVAVLYRIFMDYKEFEWKVNKLGLDIKNEVSLSDVHWVDSYFTQKMNHEGIKTITLQHGTFGSQADPWPYKGTASKFFLCFGEFTMNEAKFAGGIKGTMIPAGLPAYIGAGSRKREFNGPVSLMGIILDGGNCHEDNREMIQLMQNFCKKTNRKLLLKYHPAVQADKYNDIIDHDVVEGVYGKDISIADFGKMIDVGIVRDSTCLFDFLQQWIPTFVFRSEGQKGRQYVNLNRFCFETEEELESYLSIIGTEEYVTRLTEVREYFGIGDNTEERYKKAFRELGIL